MQEKMTESAEVAEAKKAETKEQVEAAKAEAKSKFEAFKAGALAKGEEIKWKAAEELAKAKGSIDAAKAKITEKKEAVSKDLLESYINDTIDYAAACVDLAMWASEEAKLATLDAISAQMEFDEKYGE